MFRLQAERVLRLKHILSIWNRLSIEKARKLSLLGQVCALQYYLFGYVISILLQIPFSSLRDEFLEAISEDERKEIESSCDHFPVEKVLGYLHEFILFFLAEKGSDIKNFGCVLLYFLKCDNYTQYISHPS